MADSTPKSYHTDPTLYLYTSLTAGSSHIITATSRLETILKANRIPFQALDVATNEKARMLWGRRAGKRKLPGLVRMGMLVGDLEEIEEWNEYGELKEKVGVPAIASTPSAANTPTKIPQSTSTPSRLLPTSDSPSKQPSVISSPSQNTSSSQTESSMATAMRQAGMEAAKKAGDAKAKALAKAAVPSKLPSMAQEESSVDDPKVEKAASPEKDVYEGRGSKDPDWDVAVPNSKDTISPENQEGAGISDDKSSDPDAEAVVPDSKTTIGAKDTASSSDEVAAPASKGIIEAEDKGGTVHKGADNTGGQAEETTKATTTPDQAQDLPGKKMQDQESADAEEAGPVLNSHQKSDSSERFGAENKRVASARGSSFFKTLVDHEVTVELKNDISIKGTLKSVDQFLNITLDDIQVLEEIKYPHLSSVKNVFIRGSVVRYVHLPGAAVDSALLEDATRREAAQQASKAR
ncbi:MAG: hypothetical protein Q9211_003844 [Gyalolechia sp. 1 TL-2023]